MTKPSVFSNRIESLQASATLNAKAKVAALHAQGIEVIDLTAGEPDFHTPAKIKEACKKSIDENATRYAPVPGIPELREAIAGKLKRNNDLTFSKDQIVVTCGAKHAIYTALQVLINAGDEVILPAPYWVSFPQQILAAEGKPVILPTHEETEFKITPSQLKKAIAPKTKLLILNTPSNPTGTCYTGEELEALGKICAEKKIWVLSDELYERLTFDGFEHRSILNVCPELSDRIILIHAASKAYAMTGWRMGFLAGPQNFIEKVKILQGQMITSIPTFIQHACVTAFNDCDHDVEKMRCAFEKRRDVFYEAILKIPQVTCVKPRGAFYLFPNFGATQKPAPELAAYLLDKAHVAMVSGDDFGAPNHLRLSFTLDIPLLKEAAAKIAAALSRL